MKLITYTDTRTFDDFQHREWIDTQREINHSKYAKTAPYTEEENAIIDKAPARHCFAIERPQDCKKSDAELFTEALFWKYWMVETANIKLPYDRPEIETELAETFTVESFSEYHGVSKSDLDDIKLAALFRSQPHHREAWQVDKYRDEVLKQVELYLNSKETTKERPRKRNKTIPHLPDVIKSAQYFEYILTNTVDHYYMENNEYHWESDKTLLAGLACRLRVKGWLKKDEKSFNPYEPQDLARVFCKFFNVKYDSYAEKLFRKDNVKEMHMEPFDFIVDYNEKT